MNKSELYKLPKDILVKLLCTIQEDTKKKTIEELVKDDRELRLKKCEKQLDEIYLKYYGCDIVEKEVNNVKKILTKIINIDYSYLKFHPGSYSICISPKYKSSDVIFVFPYYIEVNNTKFTVDKFLIYY